jgi:hypothetical protein
MANRFLFLHITPTYVEVSVWILWILFGCSGAKETVEKTDSKDTEETVVVDTEESNDSAVQVDTSQESCGVAIASVSPENGTTDFFYRNDIVVELTAVDPSAQIRLTGPQGEQLGVLSSEVDSTTLHFSPSDPLLSLSSYLISVETCGGVFESEFSTSELGSPLTTDVTGNSYIFDLRTGTYIQPPTLGAMLSAIIEYNILIGVTSVATTQMTVRGGITLNDGMTQNFCNRTVENFPSVGYDGRATFSLENGTFELYVTGDPLTIHNFSMESTFLSDGSAMVESELWGQLDMRQLDEMLTPNLQQLCDLLEVAGSICEACPTDGEPYCFDIEITQMTGVLAEEAMGCVLGDKCHPKCPQSECADPTSGDCTSQ